MTSYAPAQPAQPAGAGRAPVLPTAAGRSARVAAVALVVAGTVGLAAPAPASAADETPPVSGSSAAPTPDATEPAPTVADAAPALEVAGSTGPAAVLTQLLVTERRPLVPRTVRREDASRSRGVVAVVRAGRAGVLERTLVDLGAGGRVLVQERRLLEPVDRVVAVGTRPASTYGGLGWASLARCESGGDPRAVSRTGKFRGLYQFSLGTWRSVGGVGDPAAHSRDSQTAHAWKLYQRDGRAPWPECGRHL